MNVSEISYHLSKLPKLVLNKQCLVNKSVPSARAPAQLWLWSSTIQRTSSTLETVVVSCPLMLVRKSLSFLAITNLTMNKKKYEFKQLEEKFTELKHLQKLPPNQVRKTSTSKVLLEYSLDVSQSQELLATLRPSASGTEETRTLSCAILKSEFSNCSQTSISSWLDVMVSLNGLITNNVSKPSGKELTNNATTRPSTICRCITWDRATTTKNWGQVNEGKLTTTNTSLPLKALKSFFAKLLLADRLTILPASFWASKIWRPP